MPDFINEYCKEKLISHVNTIFAELFILTEIEQNCFQIKANSIYVESGCVINPSKAFKDEIENYCKRRHKKVSWNNTRTIFWID